MIKQFMRVILIASMLFLSSCSFGGSQLQMLNKYDDAGKADARLEHIIDAIKNKDSSSLKSMFSKQALDKAEDIDERIEYLFDFVKGDIESWETIVHGAAAESIHYGKKVKHASSWYYLKTDKQKYLCFFLECTIDTNQPQNVGMYMLQVIKAEDRETQFDGGGPNTRCAGIYKPKDGNN